MYAEIKSNNQILINRLDDNERIILQDFCKRANESSSSLVITALNDESAEFGGMLLEIETAEDTEE